ncbi:unnamed protein product [Protopolystoma xenopodis]|uniref:Uncharacterized protein n=1 Tax=Protopolystoma xenopodis TaxID=117903 RepID=A0A3S4ZUI2_9PLAT|nr:unnamed protein product [Protopolystoma xenopodis]
MTAKGIPHYDRAARIILKDYVRGRLRYCHPPPGVSLDDYRLAGVLIDSSLLSLCKPGISPGTDISILPRRINSPSSSTIDVSTPSLVAESVTEVKSSPDHLACLAASLHIEVTDLCHLPNDKLHTLLISRHKVSKPLLGQEKGDLDEIDRSMSFGYGYKSKQFVTLRLSDSNEKERISTQMTDEVGVHLENDDNEGSYAPSTCSWETASTSASSNLVSGRTPVDFSVDDERPSRMFSNYKKLNNLHRPAKTCGGNPVNTIKKGKKKEKLRRVFAHLDIHENT